MENEYKVTKAVKKEIKAAVKNLPPMWYKDRHNPTKVRGSTLIAKGVTTIRGGGAVSEKGWYIQNVPIKFDHQKNAEKEYQEGGILALTAYVVKYTQSRKQQENEQQKKDALAVD